MYSLAQLAAAFDVPPDTMNGWINLGRMGTKDGHARHHDANEAFALGLCSGVRHVGQPVNAAVIDAALAVAKAKPRPAEFVIAETEVAIFKMDIAGATKIINAQIGVAQ